MSNPMDNIDHPITIQSNPPTPPIRAELNFEFRRPPYDNLSSWWALILQAYSIENISTFSLISAINHRAYELFQSSPHIAEPQVLYIINDCLVDDLYPRGRTIAFVTMGLMEHNSPSHNLWLQDQIREVRGILAETYKNEKRFQ